MSSLTRIKILTTLRYFAESLFFPYISLYFTSIGYTTSQIGILIALIPITAIVFNPIYTRFCKTPARTKNALMVMSIIEGLLIICLLFSKPFWLSIVLLVLLSISSSSNYGLIDSLITLTCDEHDKPFSNVRIYGSASYMVGGFLAGYIAKWTSYPVLFSIALALFIVVGLIYFFIPVPKEVKTNSLNIRFKEILHNKKYLFYVGFYILLIGTMQVGDDFFSIYLKNRGCEDYIYSYVMLGFILVEVVIMFLLNHFWKRSSLPLYFLASGIFVVRMILQSIPTIPVGVLIASQLTRGITWGIALFVSSVYIKQILGFKTATKGIMFVMLCVSIYTAIFKFFGGSLIEWMGYSAFYSILAGLSLVSLVYFSFYYLYCKKR
ncbi:MAG: MFS transporter [Anaeroplasmataceae bacterium]|nr:MFS transporter [Anaeroplasmataceae bacterium]